MSGAAARTGDFKEKENNKYLNSGKDSSWHKDTNNSRETIIEIIDKSTFGNTERIDIIDIFNNRACSI